MVNAPSTIRSPPTPSTIAPVNPVRKIGQASRKRGVDAEIALGIQDLCLEPGPACEGVVFQTAGLDRFDRPDDLDGASVQLGALDRQLAVEVLALAGDQPENEHIEQSHRDADRGQETVVERHRDGDEDDRDQVQRVGGQPVRKQLGDLFAGGYPAGEVA